MIETLRFPDEQAWLRALVGDCRGCVDAAIASRGRAHVALSGGSTPKPFYQRLNVEPLPWNRIEWWLGDERWVLPTDPQSNERMVRETLGPGRDEFAEHFHTWHLDDDPSEAARKFEDHLKQQMGDQPVFDLVLLGIGGDGHTASLFPGTAALEEKTRNAVANEVPQMKSTRMTLTFPALNRAREIWFLVSGREKESVIQRILNRDAAFPSARVSATNQKLYWMTA